MADSAASSLSNQLTLLSQEDKELFGGIGHNAVHIRDALGQMRAILRAAGEKEGSDPRIKEWVKQVREITYDTEDVLERYLLEFSPDFKDQGSSSETYGTRGHAIGLELQEDYLKRLKSSYYDLPYYLKPCFLYLSIFPEDQVIEKWQVIELWIAEGFVEAKDGKTLEEVAETYLTELLNRSLIQVASIDFDENPFSFYIHDILREYIISKSREQNLITEYNRGEMTWPDKIRRMTIHGRFKETETFHSFKYLRSLFWFEFEGSESRLKVLRHCRLLKVLNLNNTPIYRIPKEVFQLYYLRYLGLSGTYISVVPKSIGNLQNLETLDLERSYVTEFPIEILKLHKIRHLKVSPYGLFDLDGQGLKAPYEIGSYLTSLQTLCRIDADEANGIKIVQEVGKLTQLRCLGITKLRREDAKDLCLSLVKLTNLQSIFVSCINEDEEIDLDHSLSLPFLGTICLQGHLEKFPQWVSSIHGLAVVKLSWSRLREDPLQYLEDLPNLVCLQMFRHAYEGEELIFKGGKFQKLKRLTVEELRELRCVRVEKDSMPHLRQIDVGACERMDELPEGIEQLRNLQFAFFDNMSEKFNGRVVEQKHRGLAHVASVEIW